MLIYTFQSELGLQFLSCHPLSCHFLSSQIQTISDDTWAAVSAMWDQRIQELEEMDREEEKKAEGGQAVEIVDTSLFL